MLIKVSWRIDYWSDKEKCYLKGMTYTALDDALHNMADVAGRVVKVTEEEVHA